MRVLVADDHGLFRDGMARLLMAWGFTVVGQAEDGEEAVQQTRELHPDLVLMDIEMPKLGGLEATRLIKAELPNTRVVIVTASEAREALFEAVKSGAEGYILKSISGDQMHRLLDNLRDGEPALSPGLARRLLEEFARSTTIADPDSGETLTQREFEVMERVSNGETNREIGNGLFISEETVKYHLKNVMQKLHLRNRAEVVAWALRHPSYRRAG